ncbi:MAG TPA: flagellar filament capping protein FliD [Miltoncostaeaceae bacterium]|nr:flagellar filament capping protein FliD [Miltoncostaeaceae bacterium]
MASTGTPSISFSGLGSGVDTASIIEKLMKLERQPITRLESQKKQIETRRGVVQELNGLLGKLRDAAAKLHSPTAFRGTAATSADPSVAKATTGASAPAGTYNITVNALAQAHTMASGTAPPLVAGQALDITVDGTTSSVTIDAGDTLASLAAKINADDAGGASASVVNDRLVLISRTTGSAGGISVGGDAAAGFGFTTTKAAQDASATINGLTVTSAGNSIAGAIADTTITLGKVGTTTLTVGLDTEGAVKDVKAFVDAYNGLMSNVRRSTAYDPVTKNAGALQGDQAINQIGYQLRSVAGSAVSGLGSGLDSLAQIGITAARDGTLSLDEAVLTQALTNDAAGVRSVFGRDDGVAGIGSGDGIARQIGELAKSLADDVLGSRLNGFGASLKRLDDRIAANEQRLELREKTLRAQWAAMDKAVSALQSQGNQLFARLGALN